MDAMPGGTKQMGEEALGAYLRRLREVRGLKVAAVAKAVGTSQSQISRLENGKQETRVSLLFRVVELLRGNLEHARQLLLDATATAHDGEHLADTYLGGGSTGAPQQRDPATVLTPAQIEHLLSLTPDQRAAVFELSQRMQGRKP